jgi:nicotinate phosphoribosyltransferase
VGTSLAVVRDAPAGDIVYKLVDYGGSPRRKLSTGKATLPGRKQVFRAYRDAGVPEADAIGLRSEAGPPASQPLLRKVMEGGELISPHPSLAASRSALAQRLALLPAGLRRLEGPAPFPVSLTPALERLTRDLHAERR